MRTKLGKPLVAALLCMGALSFIHGVPAPVRIVGGIVLFFWIPGLAILRLLGNRRRCFLDSIYLPLAISPVVIVVLAFAFYLATGSVRDSLTAAPVPPALLILASLLLRKKEEPETPAPVPRSILLVSFAFSGVIIIAYLMNAFLLYRIDAWYHISVVNEITNRGIPPREPWLADEPIRYMWAFHFFIAGFKERSGFSGPWAMGIFNAINAFAFPYLSARMAAHFRKEPRFVLGTPVFTIASLSSASWILWPVILVRSFFGEVRGWAEMDRAFHSMTIDGNRVVDFLTPYGLWMTNLVDKFFVITAFNFGLNLILLCFVVIVAVDRRVRFDLKAFVMAFLAILGGFLFHAILGVQLAAAAAGAGMLLLLTRFFGSKKEQAFSSFHSIAVPGAAAAAAAVASPYLLSLVGGGGDGGHASRGLNLGTVNILTIAAPLIVLWPFSVAAFRELRASSSGVHRILASWLVVLFGMNVVVNLPASNASKLVFPVFLLLTPLIAWQIIGSLGRARGMRLAGLLIAVVVLFVVPPVLTIRGFFLEKPVNPVEKRRMAVRPDELELFGWVARNTPLDAAVIEGNVYSWMPVYGQRRGFFPNEGMIGVLGYNGDRRIDRYREVRDHIFSGDPLREDDMTILESMKQALYVVVWNEDLERIPGIEATLTAPPGWFARVYGNSAGAVFRLQSGGARRDEGGTGDVGT